MRVNFVLVRTANGIDKVEGRESKIKTKGGSQDKALGFASLILNHAPSVSKLSPLALHTFTCRRRSPGPPSGRGDQKSTRLNSSHDQISYAVFCLKKKKKNEYHQLNHTKHR